MKDKLTESIDLILEEDKNDIASIKESVFKKHLLPALLDTSPDADFSRWLDIAGSWRRSIKVVDDTTEELLFVVPALVGENDLPTHQRPENSAYELVRNAQRRMAVIPLAGEEMLKRGLKDRTHATGSITKAQTEWNKIYSRYGLDELVMSGTDSTNDTSTSKVSKSEISGYDEA